MSTPTEKGNGAAQQKRSRGKPFAKGVDSRRVPKGTRMPWHFQPGEDSRRAALTAAIMDGKEYKGPTIGELCRRFTPDIVNLWRSILDDEKAQPQHRITAATALAERAWGKPSQELALEVRRGPDITELSRDALMGALARAAAREGMALPHLTGGATGYEPPAREAVPQQETRVKRA